MAVINDTLQIRKDVNILLVNFEAAVTGALIEVGNARKKEKTIFRFRCFTSTSKKEKMVNIPIAELRFDTLHHYPHHTLQGVTASSCREQSCTYMVNLKYHCTQNVWRFFIR